MFVPTHAHVYPHAPYIMCLIVNVLRDARLFGGPRPLAGLRLHAKAICAGPPYYICKWNTVVVFHSQPVAPHCRAGRSPTSLLHEEIPLRGGVTSLAPRKNKAKKIVNALLKLLRYLFSCSSLLNLIKLAVACYEFLTLINFLELLLPIYNFLDFFSSTMFD